MRCFCAMFSKCLHPCFQSARCFTRALQAALSHNHGPCNIFSGFMSGLPVVIKVLPKSMPHSKTEVQAASYHPHFDATRLPLRPTSLALTLLLLQFTKVRTHPYVARLLQVEEDVFSYYLIMERYATDLLEVLLSTDAAHDMTAVGTWFLHICQGACCCALAALMPCLPSCLCVQLLRFATAKAYFIVTSSQRTS
jgi:hypothetical protein